MGCAYIERSFDFSGMLSTCISYQLHNYVVAYLIQTIDYQLHRHPLRSSHFCCQAVDSFTIQENIRTTTKECDILVHLYHNLVEPSFLPNRHVRSCVCL